MTINNKRKFKKLTAKKAAYWLSEAWGQEVVSRDVRVRGHWVFVRDDTYNEVDCLFSPHGDDLHGEIWTGVGLEKSPFVEKDSDKIAALLRELNSEYKTFLIDDCGWDETDWAELTGEEG